MATTPWLDTSQQSETQAFGVCELAGDCPHEGIDIGAPLGTPIVDQIAGILRTIVNAGGLGNEEVIDIGQGRQILLGHESAFAVPSGSAVTPGEVIGYVGSTGFSTGPHLHFQVDVNGRPVEPSALLFDPTGQGQGQGVQLLGTGPGGIPTPGDLWQQALAGLGAAGAAGQSGAASIAGAIGTGLGTGLGAGLGAGLSSALTTTGHGLANFASVSMSNLETFANRNLVAIVVAAVVVAVLFL